MGKGEGEGKYTRIGEDVKRKERRCLRNVVSKKVGWWSPGSNMSILHYSR